MQFAVTLPLTLHRASSALQEKDKTGQGRQRIKRVHSIVLRPSSLVISTYGRRHLPTTPGLNRYFNPLKCYFPPALGTADASGEEVNLLVELVGFGTAAIENI